MHQKTLLISQAKLPTQFGDFTIAAFSAQDGKEHAAIIHGNITQQSGIPVRIHSECLTGDALGSLRCDCRAQLEMSLRLIAQLPCGIVLYLRQEGRGIGFANKIRAYSLQDIGFDTVDANTHLGLPADARSYDVAAEMLHILGVSSVSLMTNNPKKISALENCGISVTRRPHITQATPFNSHYLQTKRVRMDHLLPLS